MDHMFWLAPFIIGAVVSSDFLAALLTSFQALFSKDFSAAQALQGWNDLAIMMDSNGETNSYNWFGTVPRMAEVGHDQVKLAGLPSYNFSIKNKEWQAAVEVERMALERDRLDLITPRISQLGSEAARHPGELIFNLFELNPLAYDAVAFFATSRAIGGSGTINNLLSGTGTSVAQIQTDLAVARGQMRLFNDDAGRPMNLIGNTIVIPAQLEQKMWQALNVPQGGALTNLATLPATQTGVYSANGYSVVVNPYLTDVNDWYLLANNGPISRPFIYQVEKQPVLESDTSPDTYQAIVMRKYLYSVYGRYNVGVTDPRLAVKTTN